jgi:hypothetical protein
VAKPSSIDKAEDFYLELLSRGDSTRAKMIAPDVGFKSMMQGIANDLLAWAAGADLGEEGERLRTDQIAVTVIPPVKAQAITMGVAPDYVIGVNLGLIVFVYKLARAIAPHGVTRKADDPPPPAETETAGRIATLADWISSLVGVPRSGDWPVSTSEARWATNTAMASDLFVLSHEIAHIARGHVILDVGRADPSRLTPEQPDQRPLEQEVEADIFGALFTIESLIDRGFDPRAGMMGMEMFLQSLALAEAVGAIRTDDAHPGAAYRIAIIRQMINNRYGEAAAKITRPADQLAELMGRLGAMALSERDRRCAAAAREMDGIFNDYQIRRPRDLAADYALVKHVLELLEDTPSVVMAAIRANLLESAELAKVIDSSTTLAKLEENDRWRRHQLAHLLARNTPSDVRGTLGVFSLVDTAEWETPDSPL